MAKNENSKVMTDTELTGFAWLWVDNYGNGHAEEDRARILEFTNLTEEQTDIVIEKIKNGDLW